MDDPINESFIESAYVVFSVFDFDFDWDRVFMIVVDFNCVFICVADVDLQAENEHDNERNTKRYDDDTELNTER